MRDGITYEMSPAESISEGVIAALSEASGFDPTSDSETEVALDPLYRTIDPGALDAVFGSDATRSDGRIDFSWEGYAVSVRNEGRIHVERLEPAASPTGD